MGVRRPLLARAHRLALQTFPFSLVEQDPFADRVIRDAVLAANGEVAGLLKLTDELLVGRALDFAPAWLRDPESGRRGGLPASRVRAPVKQRTSSTAVGSSEGQTDDHTPRSSAAAEDSCRSACKSGRTVRAHDAQILDAMIVTNAIDVVEDQCHRSVTPNLALTTQLATPLFQPRLEEALLEVSPRRIGRVGHQYFRRGIRCRRFARLLAAFASKWSVEILHLRPSAEASEVVTNRPVAKRSQRVGPAKSVSNRLPGCCSLNGGLRITNVCSHGRRTEMASWGARTRTRSRSSKGSCASPLHHSPVVQR